MAKKLTWAQRRVLRHLERGGQIWAVNMDEEQGLPTSFVVAVFDGEEFLYTEPVQVRTLLELRRRGLVDVEL